jgi:hypothetical protein
MRPGAVLVSIVSLLLSLSVVVWLSNSFDEVSVDSPLAAPAIADQPDTPRPSSDEGPHPTADFAETRFNFGMMQLRDKGSHLFEVTNNGDVPLKLKAGKSSCQCTVGEVGIDEIAPGESTTIELSWEIKNPNEMFEHSAIIHTNAPEHNKGEVRLTVHGRVVAEASVVPPGSFDLGTVLETKSKPFFFYSRFHDEFQLLSVECSEKNITTEVARLTDAELEILRRELGGELPPEAVGQPIESAPAPPKCGYKITVTADPAIPVGVNEIPVTLVTDLPKTKEFTYRILARRPVPLQFFPMPGTKFMPDKTIVSGGAFDADKGKKMELLMLPAGLDKPLEISIASTEPKWLEATVSEEKSNQGIPRHRLTISIPPGAPPVIRNAESPAKIMLKTNHPDVNELKVRVTFVSR